RKLPSVEQQDRDLEDVSPLQLGVVADVDFDERGPRREDLEHHHPHLVAQMAVGLAEQAEDRAAHEPRWDSGPARRRLATRAAMTSCTMESWTTRPARSGWMPI